MRAVDHEVRGRGVRSRVDLLDRLAERLAARQAPVCLERERDDDRQADVARGSNDAERLVSAHRLGRDVPVAARPDAAGDDDRRPIIGRVLVAQRLEQSNGAAVEVGELSRRVSDPARPVGIRAPGRRIQHDAYASIERDADVRLEVAAQRGLAVLAREQVIGGEVRKLDAVVEGWSRCRRRSGTARRPAVAARRGSAALPKWSLGIVLLWLRRRV
jgi:hypothetical protein